MLINKESHQIEAYTEWPIQLALRVLYPCFNFWMKTPETEIQVTIMCLILNMKFTCSLIYYHYSVGSTFIQINVLLGVVPEYFNNHFKAAVSIYCCGTALGITVMPWLAQMFLSTYGWRGSLIITGGIGMQTIPFSALLEKTNSIKSETVPLINNRHYSHPSKEWSNYLILLKSVPFITRCLIPMFAYSYVLNGWMVYIVSFAVENGATIKESSIVASCGGFGTLVVRIVLPFVNNAVTYKQIMITSSVLAATSLVLIALFTSFVGMSITSILFGCAMGALGGEIYIGSKDVAEEDQYFNVLAIGHVSSGVAFILSGIITGTGLRA